MNATVRDARQRRTHQALVAAILDLATEHPLRDVSVSQLARTAGVHRSTVYQHADSPQALLSDAFMEELDALRDEYVVGQTGQGLAEAQRLIVMAVLEHLESHATIYRRELVDPSNHLHAMLRDHFHDSVRYMLDTYDLGPTSLNGVPERMFRDLTSRWFADASVGAMTAWLMAPAPRDPELYWKTTRLLTPDWWPSAER